MKRTTPQKHIITSTDVARHLGLSQSTVSRSMANHPSVAESTRQRVLEAAEALGYRPNALARSLITGRSGLIALVSTSMANPFYADVVREFSERLQKHGLQLLLFSVPTHDNFDDVIRKVFEYDVDGMIVVSSALSSRAVLQCRDAGLPLLLFNRVVEDAGIDMVCCDNVEGGRTIASFLYQHGHRSFGFISGVEDTSTNRDRLKGYSEQLSELGVTQLRIERGDYTYAAGREAAIRMAVHKDRPDAIFCANDIMAIGALDGLRVELNLRVPEDMSIIGFDDITMASWSGIDLTTVRQPRNRMIDASLNILLDKLSGSGKPPACHMEPGQLIIRKTVRV